MTAKPNTGWSDPEVVAQLEKLAAADTSAPADQLYERICADLEGQTRDPDPGNALAARLMLQLMPLTLEIKRAAVIRDVTTVARQLALAADALGFAAGSMRLLAGPAAPFFMAQLVNSAEEVEQDVRSKSEQKPPGGDT